MDATLDDVIGFFRRVSIAALALILVAGCSYDSDALGSVECDVEGQERSGKECRDGYWVATDTVDAGVSSDVSDTDVSDTDVAPDVDACVPPTDDELCQIHQVECGSLETDDECGQFRTTDCGECSGDQWCDEGTCRLPVCSDGEQSGEQTDVDCGGPQCEPCDDGLGCNVDADCISGVCDDGICAEPSCDDGVHNGEQTDVDCGGPQCAPCDDGLGCDVDPDCVSGVCDDGICAEPSCDDGVHNGEQTDVDCGGPNCQPCSDTKMCETDGDCISSICGVSRSAHGLIASYDFDTDGGDTVDDQGPDFEDAATTLGAVIALGQDYDNGQLDDLSGNDHHALLQGGTEWIDSGGPVSGLEGYLSHDASTESYTLLGNDADFDLDEASTFAYWRRHSGDWSDTDSHLGVDVSKGNYAYAVKHRQSKADQLEWDLRGGPGPNNHVETSPGAIRTGEWQFVVLTWDGAHAWIFVDDMTFPAAGPVPISEPIGVNDQDLLLAAQNYPGDGIRRHTDVDITGFTAFDRLLHHHERRLLKTSGASFDLTIDDEDEVEWGEGYLASSGTTMSYETPTALYDAIFDGGAEFTVELWVEAASTSQDGPARLFSLSDGTQSRNFTIGADEDTLEVRLRHAPDTDNGLPAIARIEQAITTDIEHYVVSVGAGYLRLYRNGVLVALEPVHGDLSNWNWDYPLLVGDERGGGRQWEGVVHHLAIYDRALLPAEVEDHFAFGPDAGASGQVCRILNPYVREAAEHDPILVHGQHFNGAIIDQSAHHHHGALHNGAAWQLTGGPTDALPGYLTHQRASQSLTEVADSPELDLTGRHTIAYWRRRHADLQEGWEADFAKGNQSYQVRAHGGDQTRLSYDLRRPGGEASDAVTPENTMTVDEWQFVVVVYDPDVGEDQMAIYVDDMDDPVATQDHSDDIGVNDIPLTIAAHRYDIHATGRHADLDITGFTIFDQVLDTDARQGLMDAGQ